MECNYSNYMKTIELTVARIGNSRGVRLPAGTLERYRVKDRLLMQERSDGILLKPQPMREDKLSWEETARQMSATGENWDEWSSVDGDGLKEIPWTEPVLSLREEPRVYRVKKSSGKRCKKT